MKTKLSDRPPFEKSQDPPLLLREFPFSLNYQLSKQTIVHFIGQWFALTIDNSS
jgi:hypothetical protein